MGLIEWFHCPKLPCALSIHSDFQSLETTHRFTVFIDFPSLMFFEVSLLARVII